MTDVKKERQVRDVTKGIFFSSHGRRREISEGTWEREWSEWFMDRGQMTGRTWFSAVTHERVTRIGHVSATDVVELSPELRR